MQHDNCQLQRLLGNNDIFKGSSYNGNSMQNLLCKKTIESKSVQVLCIKYHIPYTILILGVLQVKIVKHYIEDVDLALSLNNLKLLLAGACRFGVQSPNPCYMHFFAIRPELFAVSSVGDLRNCNPPHVLNFKQIAEHAKYPNKLQVFF